MVHVVTKPRDDSRKNMQLWKDEIDSRKLAQVVRALHYWNSVVEIMEGVRSFVVFSFQLADEIH